MDKAPKDIMDRMMVYRNLLAAEDHLRELLNAADDYETTSYVHDTLHSIQNIRSNINFPEVNTKYHCLNKHLAAAAEAAAEVAKFTNDAWDNEVARLLAAHSRKVLEKLIDKEIETCGRCKTDTEAETGTATSDVVIGTD